MAKLLNLGWGVSDDPVAVQPTLQDCLSSLLAQSDQVMARILEELVRAGEPRGPGRDPRLQQLPVRRAVQALQDGAPALCDTFRAELSRLLYEGGGREQPAPAMLRYEDLQLLDDADLDQSIEQARAHQEVWRMVEDVLPALDALISTLMGWRSAQPGLNPLRPDVFVRALQSSIWAHVPDPPAREALMLPAAALLGAQLRKVYRDMSDWLASAGVEPAVPIGQRKDAGAGALPVSRSVAKTLLTLERLRKLLGGDLDPQAARSEFLHTVPASMALLQEMKQEDALVQRLERERAGQPAPDAPREGAARPPSLGRQLGEQVIRLMFDNLAREGRLMAAYKRQLRALEPAVLALTRQDSRFFSDRDHPARQLLEGMTQRSLAFVSESDDGWPQFVAGIEAAAQALRQGEPDAQAFAHALERLRADWAIQDAAALERREEAARALIHAEQRNLLAQRLATEFEQRLADASVPEFVADFLKTVWPQVVAQDQLDGAGALDDARGLRAVVDDLAWSVRLAPMGSRRLRRLTLLIPGLVARLREGLRRIDYPPELAGRFFDRLGAIHASALKEGRDAASRRAAEEAEAGPSEFGASAFDDSGLWLASREAEESGYMGASFADSQAPAGDDHQEPLPGQGREILNIGAWIELNVQGQWRRVQLTWASPHQTLFMFISPKGSAHSMSRRTLERLRASGRIRVVADGNLVDEALDQVATAALRNSLDPRKD